MQASGPILSLLLTLVQICPDERVLVKGYLRHDVLKIKN